MEQDNAEIYLYTVFYYIHCIYNFNFSSESIIVATFH